MCAACEFLVSGTLSLFIYCLLYAPWTQLRRGDQRPHYDADADAAAADADDVNNL